MRFFIAEKMVQFVQLLAFEEYFFNSNSNEIPKIFLKLQQLLKQPYIFSNTRNIFKKNVIFDLFYYS